MSDGSLFKRRNLMGISKMKIDTNRWMWVRKPKQYKITKNEIKIVTEPHTDLWQRTYYHFRNDNAPVLQMETISVLW